jgi:hypothetical protein
MFVGQRIKTITHVVELLSFVQKIALGGIANRLAGEQGEKTSGADLVQEA